MTELLFTTKDVAQMLQVDKSSIKRWTDEGKLKCFRTPGGHRKFRAEDLYQFMSDYNYSISPADFYPKFASDEAVIRRMIAQKEFNVLDSVCFSAAIKGKTDEVLKLFSETHKNGMSLPLILDKILRPTLKKIDDLHASGKLMAAERQLAFNSLSNAAVLMSDIIVKPAPIGQKAICATIEHDTADIDLKALVVLLEGQGMEVLNLGTSVPADSVAELVKGKHPHFVFLLASQITDVSQVIEEHRKLQRELGLYGGRLIIGGGGYTPQLLATELNGLYDRYCSSFKEFTMVVHSRVDAGAKHDEGGKDVRDRGASKENS